MKLSERVIIEVEPKTIMNFILVEFIIELTIIDACPPPNAGINEHKGEIKNDANKGEKISFLVKVGFLIICSGIFAFVFMLINNDETPNSPVKRGKSGSLAFEFKTAMPRNPDKIKIINAESLFFSLIIRKKLEKIRTNGINNLIKS